jgi:NADH:ubiquinone oxidoreductase subunit F (NADH-binding)
VREPGVKQAPAGISARKLIDDYCGGMAEGQQLLAYLPGGARGGFCRRAWPTCRYTSANWKSTAH